MIRFTQSLADSLLVSSTTRGPLFVVAALHAFPIRQIETNDIASTRLYPASVFSLV